jgi:DNA-binding MarR family transcriptional regulator
MTELLDQCARELMNTVPQIHQAIRTEMRRGRGTDLSIPQFRTLRFIQSTPGSSLSRVADHMGLTLPSVSKLVDGLVKQALLRRRDAAGDRRCIALELTPAGEAIVDRARAATMDSLANALEELSDDELRTVSRAMDLLSPLFSPKENK